MWYMAYYDGCRYEEDVLRQKAILIEADSAYDAKERFRAITGRAIEARCSSRRNCIRSTYHCSYDYLFAQVLETDTRCFLGIHGERDVSLRVPASWNTQYARELFQATTGVAGDGLPEEFPPAQAEVSPTTALSWWGMVIAPDLSSTVGGVIVQARGIAQARLFIRYRLNVYLDPVNPGLVGFEDKQTAKTFVRERMERRKQFWILNAGGDEEITGDEPRWETIVPQDDGFRTFVTPSGRNPWFFCESCFSTCGRRMAVMPSTATSKKTCDNCGAASIMRLSDRPMRLTVMTKKPKIAVQVDGVEFYSTYCNGCGRQDGLWVEPVGEDFCLEGVQCPFCQAEGTLKFVEEQ